MSELEHLMQQLMERRISRRHFMARAAGLGLTLPAVSTLAALCAPAPATPAAVAPTPTAPRATPTEAAPGKVSALVFAHFAEVPKQFVGAFSERSGIDVTMEEVVADNHRDKILSAHRVGSSPWDTLPLWASVGNEIAHNGWLEDLTDRVEAMFRPVLDDVMGGWSVFDATRFEGRIYGVPTALGGHILHWNAALLEERGVNPERPLSWYKERNSIEEFVEFAKATTFEKDGVPHWGFAENWGDQINYPFTSYLQMFGGRLFDLEQNQPYGEPTFDREPGVDALQFMVDLMHTHKVIDPASLTYNWVFDVTPGYFDGRTAFLSTWAFVNLIANIPGETKIAGHAKVAPNFGAETTATTDGTEYHAISALAPNGADAAWQFLSFLADKEVQDWQAKNTGWGTHFVSIANDPEVQEKVPYLWAVAESWRFPHSMSFTPDYNAAMEILRAELQSAIRQEKRPDAALQEAANRIRDVRKTY